MRNSAACIRFIATLAALAPSFTSAADADSFHVALETIRTEELRNHVQVLASDTFEGREAGSAGGRAAGAYVVAQLRKLPLQPGGEDGDFYQYFGEDFRNILAILPGSDRRLKDEFIVVMGHYDHVGYGNARNSRGPVGLIHNGADDNASGVSGLLEIAQAITGVEPAPRRSILFAFWDAEERGLLGSEHWTKNPTIPLNKIRLVINVDMIGRLRTQSLEMYGIRTAAGLRKLVSESNDENGPELDFNWQTKRDSDHYPFYAQKIPFVMPYTRKHDDYHRPSDDPDKIDYEGMRLVTRLLFRTAHLAADEDKFPGFRDAALVEGPDQAKLLDAPAAPWPSRLGVVWSDELAKQNIVKLTQVEPGSPAEAAGLRIGDRIVEVERQPVESADSFRALVLAASSPAEITVSREGEPGKRRLRVQLVGEPLKFGLSWRTDDGEPGTVILNRIAVGSPAYQAGLRIGDRIYAIGGRPFASETEFRQALADSKGPVKVVTERRGRIRSLEIRPVATPAKPAPQ
ncbi:MAG: M28 family peptidase [Planctomycetaceae bacterium]